MVEKDNINQAGFEDKENWLDLTVTHIKWDEPKIVTGKLVEIQDNLFGVPFYVLEDDNKKRIGVIATTVLSSYINKRMIGNIFRIEYTGDTPASSNPENMIKNFVVKTRKPNTR